MKVILKREIRSAKFNVVYPKGVELTYNKALGMVEHPKHKNIFMKVAKKDFTVVESKLQSVITKANVLQIPENALLHEVVLAIRGREIDKVEDATDAFYYGDVFEQIANEQAELAKLKAKTLSKKAIDQLDELAELIDSEYVIVTDIENMYK